MEGMQKPSLDELIANAQNNITDTEGKASSAREKAIELFEGKVPSDEIIKEIKDLDLKHLPDGSRSLEGTIKGHEIILNQKLEYGDNSGGGPAYKLEGAQYIGTIDGNELSREDAEKLFGKYANLRSVLRGIDAAVARANEEAGELAEKDDKTKEAVDDLMNL